MPDKTKTIVIIESHEQTIIRRSRRVISSQLPMQRVLARPIGSASGETERLTKREERGFVAWCRTVTLKGFTVFAPWSRRLKHRENERRNQHP